MEGFSDEWPTREDSRRLGGCLSSRRDSGQVFALRGPQNQARRGCGTVSPWGHLPGLLHLFRMKTAAYPYSSNYHSQPCRRVKKNRDPPKPVWLSG